MKIPIILIVLLAGIFVGCSNNEPAAPISDENFRTGTTGLEMEFLENGPPSIIYETSSFQVALNLKNAGAYDINKAKVIVNFEKDYMEALQSPSNTIALIGRSIINPDGEEKPIFFRMKAKNLEAMSETHISLIQATACYTYESITSDSACIDSDIYNMNSDKACKVETINSGSQGAPIAVTMIEPRYAMDDNKIIPSYLIVISNAGSGNPILSNNVDDFCSASVGKTDDWNKIRIDAKLGNVPMSCFPNPVKLSNNGDTFITCSLDEGIEGNKPAYVTPITIKLDYGYSFTISKEVEIGKRRIS